MILQATQQLAKDTLPKFKDFINIYGWWLGLIVFLVILFLIAQYCWFNRVIKAKDSEIDRLVKRESELNARLLKIIDDTIGFKEKKSKP